MTTAKLIYGDFTRALLEERRGAKPRWPTAVSWEREPEQASGHEAALPGYLLFSEHQEQPQWTLRIFRGGNAVALADPSAAEFRLMQDVNKLYDAIALLKVNPGSLRDVQTLVAELKAHMKNVRSSSLTEQADAAMVQAGLVMAKAEAQLSKRAPSQGAEIPHGQNSWQSLVLAMAASTAALGKTA